MVSKTSYISQLEPEKIQLGSCGYLRIQAEESPFYHGRSWMKDFLALISEGAPSATFSSKMTTTVDGRGAQAFMCHTTFSYLCKSASSLDMQDRGYEKNGSHLRNHVPRTVGRFLLECASDLEAGEIICGLRCSGRMQ